MSRTLLLIIFLSACSETHSKTVDFMSCEWDIPESFFELTDDIENLNRDDSGVFRSIGFLTKDFVKPKLGVFNDTGEEITEIHNSVVGNYNLYFYNYKISQGDEKPMSFESAVLYDDENHIRFFNVKREEVRDILTSCISPEILTF